MASIINVGAGLGNGRIVKSADNSGLLTLQTNTTDALAIPANQNITCSSTGSLAVPSGTTGQRPSPATNGMLRYNTTIPQLEIYINGWVALP